MNRYILIFLLLVTNKLTAQEDSFGSRDINYLPRIDGYFISEFYSSDYDEYSFYDGKDYIKTAGKIRIIRYAIKDNKQAFTVEQVIENYKKLFTDLKGKIMFHGQLPEMKTTIGGHYEVVTFKKTGKSADLWVEVFAFNNGEEYELIVIEKYK